MRRFLLLMGGICGSILVGWQLIISANSILEKQETSVMVQAPVDVVENKDDTLLFPIAIPDTALIAQYPVLYEGPFLEDGSWDYVVDVAALVVFNTARTDIENARIVLQWKQGAYVFEAELLPARTAVLVLDKCRQKYAQHDWVSCVGTQQAGGMPCLSEDALTVEHADMGTIRVTNITSSVLRGIRVYYKSYLSAEDLYIGGIAYSLDIPELAPGESTTVSPFRYADGYSKVVRVCYANSE